MKILILGVTGMLGSQLFKTYLSKKLDVYGIMRRSNENIQKINPQEQVFQIEDIRDTITIEKIINKLQPNFIINSIGIVKQSILSENHIESIEINSLLPHKLALLCKKYSARLIHISTDCVFDGKHGNYKENDISNATDLYGKSKYLGEVGYDKHLTVRTSIIGHEYLGSTHGLLEWFLSQNNGIKGFTKAYFSGVTTLELSHIIQNYILNNNDIHGLIHIAGNKISKFNLLKTINQVYNKQLIIQEDTQYNIDRSLNASHFQKLTSYSPPSWYDLINQMKQDYESYHCSWN